MDGGDRDYSEPIPREKPPRASFANGKLDRASVAAQMAAAGEVSFNIAALIVF